MKRLILKGGERCVYCGYFADVRDHVVPWSFHKASGARRTFSDVETVPACRECNGIASDNVFDSLEAKREYVQGKKVFNDLFKS